MSDLETNEQTVAPKKKTVKKRAAPRKKATQPKVEQPTEKKYEIVVEKLEANINNHKITGKRGEVVELTDYEAEVLVNHVKETE